VKLSRAGEWEALSGVCKPRYVVGRSRRKEAGVDGSRFKNLDKKKTKRNLANELGKVRCGNEKTQKSR